MPSKTKAFAMPGVSVTRIGDAFIHHGDALRLYESWAKPTCIIVDGPYGLGKFPGETRSVADLPEWYAPHVAAWSKLAATNSTLWFWGSELSWATVHPVLDLNGWQYEETVVWDKGIAHVAGNVNSKTIRGLPVVTEVAVRYTKRNRLPDINGAMLPLKEWIRAEWLRSGLPMNQANAACGVKNAATRKYLTQCHLWYFPPSEAMESMAAYCTTHGAKTDRPYFSLDGRSAFSGDEWSRMRAKWYHTHSLTNVWKEPPVHGRERVRSGGGYLHANQKPLALMERQIVACTDKGDVVWEPFGGLCSASLAAVSLGRRAYAAEMNLEFFEAAVVRLKANLNGENQKAA